MVGLTLIERETPLKAWMHDYEFVLVQSIDHLKELVDKAIEAPYCAFDLESTGLDTRVFKGQSVDVVVGYSIAFEKSVCYYIPVRHKVETSRGKNLPLKETNEQIQRLVNEAVVVGHNWLKFDGEMMLASDGITLKTFKPGEEITYHDSYVLARLAGYKPAGLKYLSKNLIGKEMIEITEVVTSGKDVDFGSVSPYEGLVYAASDAICTKEIFEHPTIQAPIKEQEFVYNLERKVLYVVRTMERNKIRLNVDFCKELDKDLLDKINGCVKKSWEILSEFTEGKTTQFNLDSTAETADVLFNIFDMNPKPERGASGVYKTDDATLDKLADKYELAKVLQQYRMYTKFHRTYIKNMLANVDEDGYLKFQFSSLQTDTGRFASPGGGRNGDGCSGVNIQSIPARYDTSKPNIRKCIACDDDEVFVAMDWAGVELRIATNLSLEPIWLDRFVNGDGDLHTSTASIIYDKSEHEVSKEERQTGKTFNFQSVYGGGPGALARALETTIDDAKEKQGRFFGRLQGLRSYIKSLQRFAQKSGYCKTKFGRKRVIPEYKSDDPKDKAKGDRNAVNTPIQGTAADLMKLAMVKMDEYIETNNLRDYVKMVLTMHDEVGFRIKKTHLDHIFKLEEVMKLKPILEKIGWTVPLDVDVEVGDSWDIHYELAKMVSFLKEEYNQESLSYIYSGDKDYDQILKEYKDWLDRKKQEKANTEKKTSIEKVSPNEKSKEDFKKMGSSIVSNFEKKSTESTSPKDTENTLTSSEEITVGVSVGSNESAEHSSADSLESDSQGEIVDFPSLEESKKTSEEDVVEAVLLNSQGDLPASATDLDNVFKILKSANLSDLPIEAHGKLKKSFYEQEIERILAGYPSENDEGIEMPLIVHSPIDDMKKSYMGMILDTCKGKGRIKFVTSDKQELHEGWFEVDVLKASMMAKIFNL